MFNKVSKIQKKKTPGKEQAPSSSKRRSNFSFRKQAMQVKRYFFTFIEIFFLRKRKMQTACHHPESNSELLACLASFSHHYITTLIRQTPEKFNHLTDCLTITSIIDDRIPIPNLSANLT